MTMRCPATAGPRPPRCETWLRQGVVLQAASLPTQLLDVSPQLLDVSHIKWRTCVADQSSDHKALERSSAWWHAAARSRRLRRVETWCTSTFVTWLASGRRRRTATIRRKRSVFHNVLGYAAELEELSANPLDRVKWKPPKVAEVVDRRVVVNPHQARELLTAVTYVGRPWRGRHLRAFFACMYFAALRPGEVKALRKDGCLLPASGWGRLTLSRSRPQSNKRWTDSGEAFDDRGLKHRAEDDTRSVPIPPELVTILREHIEEFGTAADGRLFRTVTGRMICDTTHTWAVARTLALTPGQVVSPLAARPYDLRHAAVSLWLNGGVAATEVANCAGHSAEVLLRVYAKCIDGGEEAANRRIDEALAD